MVIAVDVSMRRTTVLAMCAQGLLTLAGCVNREAREARYQGADDLHCPADQVSAYQSQKGPYVAEGCGRWVAYECISTRYRTRCFPRAEPVVHTSEKRPAGPNGALKSEPVTTP